MKNKTMKQARARSRRSEIRRSRREADRAFAKKRVNFRENLTRQAHGSPKKLFALLAKHYMLPNKNEPMPMGTRAERKAEHIKAKKRAERKLLKGVGKK